MKRKFGVFLAWIIFLGTLAAAFLSIEIPISTASEPVTVICIQTAEDADSTLLTQGSSAVLIDAGTEQDGDRILEILREQGISSLDYLILSHPDKDHIGGAMQILTTLPVGRVIQPYYTKGNEELEEINTYCEDNAISILHPNHTSRLRVGQMQILVYPPLEKNYKETNNYSLAVLVRHEKISMLFTGDALRKRSQELLYIDWPRIDLYKVPHHGRANSMTEMLFSTLHPAYAVITSNQADDSVVKAGEKEGSKLLYTLQGDCIFESDGNTLYLKKEGGRFDGGKN